MSSGTLNNAEGTSNKPEETSKRCVKKGGYGAEVWLEARRLYQGGMSLEGVSEKMGIAYSTVQYHAWVEGWGVRARGGKKDPEYQRKRAEKIERRLAKEEALMAAEAALLKVDNLEVVARKSLVADSARAKVMVSRLVKGILERLEDPGLSPRSAAQALGSLAPIFRLVYRWDEECGEEERERVWTRQAINPALMAIPPEQLSQLSGD